jgi:hypothetical protein
MGLRAPESATACMQFMAPRPFALHSTALNNASGYPSACRRNAQDR